MAEARQDEIKWPRYWILFSSGISFVIAAVGLAIGLYELDFFSLGIGVFFVTRGYRTVAVARATNGSRSEESAGSIESQNARFELVLRRTAYGYGIAGCLCAASTAVGGEVFGVLFGLFLLASGALHWFAPRLSQGGEGAVAGRRWPTRWFP